MKLFAGPTPDGSYISRSTHNSYAFATALISTAEKVYRPRDPNSDEHGYIPNPLLGQYVSGTWHSTRILAEKSADKLRQHNRGVVVVPVIDGKPPVDTTTTGDLDFTNPTSKKENTTMADGTLNLLTGEIKMNRSPKSTTRKATAKKANKVTARDQGFPAVYCGPNGNFIPGYDAKAKRDLANIIAGTKTGKELAPRLSKAQAVKLQESRGW